MTTLPTELPPLDGLAFEDLLALLDTHMAHMEEGSLSLQDSVMVHKQGAILLAEAAKRLQHAEQDVQILNNNAWQPHQTR